jgi:hypothetical protein
MAKQSKTSSSSQPTAAPLATVADSLLANTTNSNYLAFLNANAAAARLLGQQSESNLNVLEEVEEEEFNPDDRNTDDETSGNSTPLLSDIKVLSNTVVYDAANNPSVRVVFRVTNSSGKVLKGVDVKRTKQ